MLRYFSPDAELPRATQTSALSSAGVLRLFNRVGETVNKMTFKMDESDQVGVDVDVTVFLIAFLSLVHSFVPSVTYVIFIFLTVTHKFSFFIEYCTIIISSFVLYILLFAFSAFYPPHSAYCFCCFVFVFVFVFVFSFTPYVPTYFSS